MKWSGTDRPVLVIGYGNSLRRDDGAGLVLAAALVDDWQANGLPATGSIDGPTAALIASKQRAYRPRLEWSGADSE